MDGQILEQLWETAERLDPHRLANCLEWPATADARSPKSLILSTTTLPNTTSTPGFSPSPIRRPNHLQLLTAGL
jgi:hypothetical protein